MSILFITPLKLPSPPALSRGERDKNVMVKYIVEEKIENSATQGMGQFARIVRLLQKIKTLSAILQFRGIAG